MLASTSRAAFWQSAAQIQSCSFSTTARCSAKRRVLVELLEDVPRLGKKFDKEMVKPGFARYCLVPLRKARLVAASPIQKYRRETLGDRIRGPHRTVPFWDVEDDPERDPSLLIPAQRKPKKNLREERTRAQEHEARVSLLLAQVPPSIEFALRTIAPNDPAVHGSVTLSDVAERLMVNHELRPADVRIFWADETRESDARIKELGVWKAVVEQKGGAEQKRMIDVRVVRLQETQPVV